MSGRDWTSLFLPTFGTSVALYSLGYWALDHGNGFERIFGGLFARGKEIPHIMKIEWCIRTFSTLNCCLTMAQTLSEFYRKPELFDDPLAGKTDNLVIVSASFLGYITYDLGITFINYKDLGFASVIFHHVLMLFLGLLGNYLNTFFPLAGIWTLNEISTIFININWFFTRMEEVNGYPVPKILHLINRILIWVSFFLFRVILHGYIDTKVVQEVLLKNPSKYNQAVKLFSATLVPAFGLLNFYWFYLLNKKYIKVLFFKKEIVEGGSLD